MKNLCNGKIISTRICKQTKIYLQNLTNNTSLTQWTRVAIDRPSLVKFVGGNWNENPRGPKNHISEYRKRALFSCTHTHKIPRSAFWLIVDCQQHKSTITWCSLFCTVRRIQNIPIAFCEGGVCIVLRAAFTHRDDDMYVRRYMLFLMLNLNVAKCMLLVVVCIFPVHI